MHWLNHHPDDLIERTEPSEALALLRKESVLNLEQANKLDTYLHHWTLALLQRMNDSEGVQEVLTLSEIAQDLLPESVEGKALQQRWGGFEDLLEGKRRHLLAQTVVPPIQLKQQDLIVQFIQQSANRRVKQLDLADQLKLSKGRISQILGVLESRGIVTRQRLGKDSWVSLPQTEIAPDLSKPSLSPKLADQHLGARVFSFRKAA
jgi:hypothetical protein